MNALQILTTAGFILSAYALYVKWRVSVSKHYTPFCDIAKGISCTRAFTSKYGTTAGMPNPLLGIIFYAAIFALAGQGSIGMVRALAALATLGSVYLAYVSYVKQRNFCVVCTAIYIVNALLLYGAYA